MRAVGRNLPVAVLLAMGAITSGSLPALGAPGMVQNGGLEEGLAGWGAPEQLYALDGAVAHGGVCSLRYHNAPQGPYLLASQGLPLQPGRCYRVTAWVRTEDVVSSDTGAAVCLEWHGAEGYIGGAYPPGITGTYDWQQVVYETGPMPEGVTGGSVTVYGRQGTHGTAWFDDIEVTRVSPLAEFRFAYRPPDVRRTRLFLDARAAGIAFQAVGTAERRSELEGLTLDVALKRGPQTDHFEAPMSRDGRAEVSVPTAAFGSGETLAEVSLRSEDTGRPIAGESFFIEGAQRLRLDIVKPNPAGVLGLNGRVQHRMTVRLVIDPGEGELPGACRARFSWRAEGRPVASPSTVRVTAGAPNLLSIPVPLGLEPGTYDLRCDVGGPAGGSFASALALVSIVDPAERPVNATWIGPNRMLTVDGEPFFPIGFYLVSSLETVFPVSEPYRWTDNELHPEYYLPILDRLGGSHFNCVIDYSSVIGGLDPARAFMDAAHERGLRTIFSVKDLMKGAYFELFTRRLPWQDLREANRGVVEAFRRHPSLIAWYINDEVFTPDLWQGAVNVFRDTRATDPWHPTYAVHYDYKGLGAYRSACDAIGTDPYTLLGDIGFTSRSWHEARQMIGPDQPLWAVVQCFGPGYEFSNPTETREPTFDEERAATLAAIAEGATGIIYYCYHSLERSPRFEERFAELDRIAAEVQGLLTMLTLPDARSPVTVLEGKDVSVLTKRDGERLRVLLVSTSRDAQEVTLKLPPGMTQPSDRATSEMLQGSGNTRRVHLDGLAARTLVLARER